MLEKLDQEKEWLWFRAVFKGSEVILERKGQRPGFSFSIRKNAEDRREGVSDYGGDGLWE